MTHTKKIEKVQRKREVLRRAHHWLSKGAGKAEGLPTLQRALGGLAWKAEVAWMEATRETLTLRMVNTDAELRQKILASMMSHPSFALKTPVDPDGYDVYGNHVGGGSPND